MLTFASSCFDKGWPTSGLCMFKVGGFFEEGGAWNHPRNSLSILEDSVKLINIGHIGRLAFSLLKKGIIWKSRRHPLIIELIRTPIQRKDCRLLSREVFGRNPAAKRLGVQQLWYHPQCLILTRFFLVADFYFFFIKCVCYLVNTGFVWTFVYLTQHEPC